MNTTSTRRARALPRGVLSAAIALCMLVPTATAAAHDPPDQAPGTTALDRAASETIDIGIIAADTGWTLDATRRHMADQDTFGALQLEIETRFPTTFAGAEFAEVPGGRSWLRFKATVPQAARTLAAATGLDVGLTGGRRFSATELAVRAEAVVRFLADSGYRPVSAEVQPNGLIAAAATGPDEGLQLPPALREGVSLTFTDLPAAGELHGYGGAKVRNDADTSRCTTGFSVESLITGETGVSTAAHCTGMTVYEQPWTLIRFDYDLQDQHVGSFGDVEWHTTVDHSDLAEYYADNSPSDRREVNSVETGVAVNNTYCLYSHMGGDRTCDQVRSTFVIVWTSGPAANLVGMDDYNAEPGDSGGPWSYGTEAAGTVVGWYWVPFGSHDAWNRAWYFDSALDVEVMTM